MSNGQLSIIVALLAVTTYFTRLVPLLFFPDKKETPPFVLFLGRALPFAIIGMLVIYCLKDVSLIASPHGLPELIAVAAVALLHIWKNNLFLSIGGGTVLYMFLVQVVFAG